MNFASWAKVTHETKKKVLAAIPKKDLEELGCRNPDIAVVSKEDDRIVICPSKTARGSESVKKSRVVTNVKASEVLGDDWKSKIPVMKLIDQHVWLENIVAKCHSNEALSVAAEWNRSSVYSVTYRPNMPKPLLIIKLRQPLRSSGVAA
jgi:hypothetical protein